MRPSAPPPLTAPLPRTFGHGHPSHGPRLGRVSWRPGRRFVRRRPGPSAPSHPRRRCRDGEQRHQSHGRELRRVSWRLGRGFVRRRPGHPPRHNRHRRCQKPAGIGSRLAYECFGEYLGGLTAGARPRPGPSAPPHLTARTPRTSGHEASVSWPRASASILAAGPRMRRPRPGPSAATSDSARPETSEYQHPSHGRRLRRVSGGRATDMRGVGRVHPPRHTR